MAKEIYILRHGETDLNKEHIIQGSGVDAGLNELGRRQARAFYDYYRFLDFEVVLTSCLRRTHETVAPFLDQGLPWEQFAEINEICWGKYEGKKSTPALKRDYRQMLDEWGSGNLHARMDEGESAAELAARLQRFIEHLGERPEQRILVCSHGRAMRCLMCLLEGKDLGQMENYRHSNTGLYHVLYDRGNYWIEKSNDTRHLELIERF